MSVPLSQVVNMRLTNERTIAPRSSKTIESSKWKTYLHCLFHFLMIGAALAIIYWGLILGKVFMPVEKDYLNNPRFMLLRPPGEATADSTDKDDTASSS